MLRTRLSSSEESSSTRLELEITPTSLPHRIQIAGDDFDGDVAVRDHAEGRLIVIDNNKAADMLKAHLPCTVADGLVSRDRGDLMHGHVDDFHRASSHVFYLFPGTLSALRNE